MRIIRLLSIVLLACLITAAFAPVSTQAGKSKTRPRIYVKFDGISGPVEEKDHKGWSQATDLSFDVSQPSESVTDPTRRRGDVIFSGVTITKYAAQDSPKLAEAVFKGKVFSKVEIESVARLGVLWEIDLTNVTITAFNSGINSTDGRLMESIQLLPEEMRFAFHEYDRKGVTKGITETSWNFTGP